MNIFYNENYSKNSLYGAGYFPFWVYIKYFGKPVYIKCRKFGLNKFFSLFFAHTLGAVIHVGFFMKGLEYSFNGVIISYAIFPLLFYIIHLAYSHRRKKMLTS